MSVVQIHPERPNKGILMFDLRITLQLLLILSVSSFLVVALGGAFGLVTNLFVPSLISLGGMSAVIALGILLYEA